VFLWKGAGWSVIAAFLLHENPTMLASQVDIDEAICLMEERIAEKL